VEVEEEEEEEEGEMEEEEAGEEAGEMDPKGAMPATSARRWAILLEIVQTGAV